MLLLRALPLSLAILWRFLLVLPLWAVAYLAITFVVLMGGAFVAFNVPVVGAIVLMLLPLVGWAVACMIAVHPYMVGIAIGLRVLGLPSAPSQKRLMGASVGYGLFMGLVGFVLIAAIGAAFMTPALGGPGLSLGWRPDTIIDPVAALAQGVAYGTVTLVAALSGLAILALQAAMLPVLAGVAAGGRPGGLSPTPMAGFGRRFAAMMVLLLAITGLSTLAVEYLRGAGALIGLGGLLTDRLAAALISGLGGADFAMSAGRAVAIGGAIVLSVWLFCLQCAGAALIHHGEERRPAAPRPRADAPEETGPTDIAALRRARMNAPAR